MGCAEALVIILVLYGFARAYEWTFSSINNFMIAWTVISILIIIGIFSSRSAEKKQQQEEQAKQQALALLDSTMAAEQFTPTNQLLKWSGLSPHGLAIDEKSERLMFFRVRNGAVEYDIYKFSDILRVDLDIGYKTLIKSKTEITPSGYVGRSGKSYHYGVIFSEKSVPVSLENEITYVRLIVTLNDLNNPVRYIPFGTSVGAAQHWKAVLEVAAERGRKGD
ncbi:hypothetical protein HPY42_05490 [Coprothermobacteraceae bacterium]|nr:hypothetical protein [Coprothermobacteraceae bacterium]